LLLVVNAAKKREPARGTPAGDKASEDTTEEQNMDTTNTADAEAMDDEEADLNETHLGEGEEKVDGDSKEGGVDAPDGAAMVICPPGLATRIHKAITLSILPQLQKCLVQKVGSFPYCFLPALQ